MMRALVLLSCLMLAACDDAQAMKDCEKSHSFDTCFYTLNR